MPRSIARVPTDNPGRYGRQLLSHLGRKTAIEPLTDEPDGGTLVFAFGRGTIWPKEAHLELIAQSPDEEGLSHVQDVLARHLERFGARDELVVNWEPK
jgi:uncharacterized protein